MFLGIGVGAGLEDLRIDYPRPVRALREAIVGIRGLLAGENVELDGEMFPIDGARLVRPPETPVPISVGTRSRQVMQLAGELADIALVGARHFTAEIAQLYRRWLADGAARAGRDVADIDVAPRLTLCVSSDGDLARRSVVRYVAHYLAIIRPSEMDPDRLAMAIDEALGRATGWYFDLDRYDPPELFDLVSTEDWIRRYAVVGAPSEIPEQVKEVTDPRVHECQPVNSGRSSFVPPWPRAWRRPSTATPLGPATHRQAASAILECRDRTHFLGEEAVALHLRVTP